MKINANGTFPLLEYENEGSIANVRLEESPGWEDISIAPLNSIGASKKARGGKGGPAAPKPSTKVANKTD
jgi:hypothetical protein